MNQGRNFILCLCQLCNPLIQMMTNTTSSLLKPIQFAMSGTITIILLLHLVVTFCLFNHLQGSTKYVVEFCHSHVLHHEWWVNMGISPLTIKQIVHFKEMELSRQRHDFVEHKGTTFQVATCNVYKTCFFLHSSYMLLAWMPKLKFGLVVLNDPFIA